MEKLRYSQRHPITRVITLTEFGKSVVNSNVDIILGGIGGINPWINGDAVVMDISGIVDSSTILSNSPIFKNYIMDKNKRKRHTKRAAAITRKL